MTIIQSFTDLNAWKESHKLVLLIYKFSRTFPPEEKFGLTNQIRRATLSITSNITEGFSRNSAKEKAQFYYMALGSLRETQNQLILAKDLGYLAKKQFSEIFEISMASSKLINGLIKSAKKMAPRS
ncbi:four helix bundle protein [Candidatus Curtissbacteria bacterium]|nr:four helix bundle protein [Candidatus Curtissbacteria bacterium]